MYELIVFDKKGCGYETDIRLSHGYIFWEQGWFSNNYSKYYILRKSYNITIWDEETCKLPKIGLIATPIL